MALHDLLTIAGIIVAIAGGLFGIWWRVEARQDKAIKSLAKENSESHADIHKKMDKLRDKIEEIWKHLVHRK